MHACLGTKGLHAACIAWRPIDRDRNTAAARSDQQLMGVLCVSMEGRPHMLVPQQLLARERERESMACYTAHAERNTGADRASSVDATVRVPCVCAASGIIPFVACDCAQATA